jgi:FAD/FMN-containing dehydrogenase
MVRPAEQVRWVPAQPRHPQEPVPAVGGRWATIRAVGTLEALASRLSAGAVSSDPEILAERAIAHAQAVGSHLSHLYPTGSSLYFTFRVGGADDQDAETRYRAAWDRAAHSCSSAGGTLTHHHGVGRLKCSFLTAELGQTGVDVLAAIKAALDPGQIMNPEALLP